MTKLITIAIIAAAVYVGWVVFEYWERVKSEQDVRSRSAVVHVPPEQLPGLPHQLEQSLREAERRGAAGLREWLRRYHKAVQDPRRAWIELDYVVLVTKSDPAEARRVFAEVKERTPPDSPVYPRIKELERTYQQ